MGKKRVSDTYRANLSSWASREQANLGGISYREWAKLVTERTGIEVNYGVIERWIKGSYRCEMEESNLIALSRWRNDSSFEATRNWLWGQSLYDRTEVERVTAWIRTAQPEEVAIVVKEGVEVLVSAIALQPEPETPENVLPELAIAMQAADVDIETLLDKSGLDEDEWAITEKYLTGQLPQIEQKLLDHLKYNLERIVERHTPKVPEAVLSIDF